MSSHNQFPLRTAILAIGLMALGCAENRQVQANLANFDDLDYNVFNKQKWAELRRSHSPDIEVHWPNGRTTVGLDQHIDDLKSMFAWAPDTRIQQHPVKFGQDGWTAVIGIIEGTFTEPMPVEGGDTIPPTGKAFKFHMASIAHWNQQGVMDEEYLFWDNHEFMRQIGVVE